MFDILFSEDKLHFSREDAYEILRVVDTLDERQISSWAPSASGELKGSFEEFRSLRLSLAHYFARLILTGSYT
jgi:hypothetical protein